MSLNNIILKYDAFLVPKNQNANCMGKLPYYHRTSCIYAIRCRRYDPKKHHTHKDPSTVLQPLGKTPYYQYSLPLSLPDIVWNHMKNGWNVMCASYSLLIGD